MRRLLIVARYGTAHHIEQMVRNYRRCQRLKLLHEDRRNHALREISWHLDVAAATPRGGVDEWMRPQPVATRRADALERVAEAECDDCGQVAAKTSRRMACDASIVKWREYEDGEPLSIGRKTRTIPPAIRRALHRRDGGCRFPGCSCRRFVDAHHIHHWADGAGNEIWFSYPTGDNLPSTADGRFRGNAERVRAHSAQKSLEITSRTLPPQWDDGPMDYNYAQQLLEQYDQEDR